MQPYVEEQADEVHVPGQAADATVSELALEGASEDLGVSAQREMQADAPEPVAKRRRR